jgi:branched-chain amino acid transport system substrate-binding protein
VPIKIGNASPLSGNQAETGIDQMRGAQVAIDELNQKGGILGRQVELVTLDDKADPKEANSVAQRLAADPDVVAVVGHLNSGCSIPASKIYHENSLAMITPISTSDALTQQGFRNVFRVCIRNSDQGPAAARFAMQKLGKMNFFIIDDKTAYGAGLADEFEKAAKELGGNVSGRASITEGETDFRAVLTPLRDKPIDFIYFGGMYPEGALILKQARELGISAPCLSGDGMYSPKLIEIAGPAATGSIVTHIAPLEAKNATAKAFFDRFRGKYGEDVKVYAPLSYDCVMIIAQAITDSGKAERNAIIETLHSAGFNHEGIIGTTRFDDKGDTVNKHPYFYEVKDGRFVLCN